MPHGLHETVQSVFPVSAFAATGLPMASMTHMLVLPSVVCRSSGRPVNGSEMTDTVPVPAISRLVIMGTPLEWDVPDV